MKTWWRRVCCMNKCEQAMKKGYREQPTFTSQHAFRTPPPFSLALSCYIANTGKLGKIYALSPVKRTATTQWLWKNTWVTEILVISSFAITLAIRLNQCSSLSNDGAPKPLEMHPKSSCFPVQSHKCQTTVKRRQIQKTVLISIEAKGHKS